VKLCGVAEVIGDEVAKRGCWGGTRKALASESSEGVGVKGMGDGKRIEDLESFGIRSY
jgi:hypothetical protein